MAQKKVIKGKSPQKEHIHAHVHLWDIPKKYFPRRTNAKEYLDDLIRTTSSLRYTNMNVQYGAQIAAFNIKSILPSSSFMPRPQDVFRKIEEFVYHYENYCFRLYTYREKLMQFVNAFLPIGYDDRELRLKYILINPVVKHAGLLNIFIKFKDNAALSSTIKDRQELTHRLFYGRKFDNYLRPNLDAEIKSSEEFNKWSQGWKKEIISRAQRTNRCMWIIDDINNKMAEKLIKYKKEISKR